jgi:hypothetical protein
MAEAPEVRAANSVIRVVASNLAGKEASVGGVRPQAVW